MKTRRRPRPDLWVVLILLLAAWLRLAHLGQIPACLEYDEAANVILSGEIAQGKAFPVFIRPYTGKEALYFYLAAGMMRLAGVTPFALRLTSAFLGLLNVALTWWFARQLFAVTGLEEGQRRWLARFSAALVAISYWQVNLSRFGYRAIALPPLLALAVGFWLRGLRGGREDLAGSSQLSARWFALSGALSGLSAYTYSSVRVYPFLLLLLWLWVLIADRRRWRVRLGQMSLFGLAALVAFAPLGLFFLRHPEAFSVRISQVSVFSPAVNEGDLWGTLWRTTRLAFGMFTRSGDMNPLYNYPGKPVYDRLLGPAFYLGLLICVGRLLFGGPGGLLRRAQDASGSRESSGGGGALRQAQDAQGSGAAQGGADGRVRFARLPYFALLSWLLVMMVPNLISASGVPHNLRAMALVPAVFVVPALGIVVAAAWVTALASRLGGLLPSGRAARNAGPICGRRGPSVSGREAADRQPGAQMRSRLRESPPTSGGQASSEPERASLDLSVLSVSPWFPGHVLLARALLVLLLLSVLGYEGARTYVDYVYVWARSAAPYYKGNQALIRAADLLNAHPEADPYVATYFQQHATLAVVADDYERIRWVSGRTLVYPPPGGPPALAIYDHTNPLDPLLRERYLPPGALLHRERGPDGGIAFETYWVPPQPLPSPGSQMHVDLGHTLAFLGYDLNAPPRSGQLLDVTLFFQVLREVDRDDFTFFAHLVDDLGFRWAGETFFHYPSAQWRPGEVMLFRLLLDVEPDAPPGTYQLDVGVFSPSLDARLPVLNEAGQMAGTVLSVGPIAMMRAEVPPTAHSAIQQPQEAAFGDTLVFLGSDRDRSDLRPGETLALTLYWQAKRPVEEEYLVAVWLSGPEGDIWLWRDRPVHGLYPFSRWQEGEFVRDRYALRLPIDVVPGDYDLRLALLAADGHPLPVTEGQRASATQEELSLGTLHVRSSDRLWEVPALAHPVGARLGDRVELLGYDLDRDRVRPGEALHLTLVWRCRNRMDVAYTIFTHLLDQGQHIHGQKDNPPLRGAYPTTLWVPGEVVVDPYEIRVAPDAAPGSYVIEVGMYDPDTMQRLSVLDPSGAVGDRILLADVQVVGGE